MYRDLPTSAQTAYAQLFEACQGGDFLRTVADLPGSFAAKEVKGHKYWYYQYTEPAGKLRQVYVGPDSDEVRALIEKKSQPTSQEGLGRLARAATALGCEEIRRKHFRVIARLAEYGFFRAGGVLIGTHAFIAYGNMLGVHWDMADRTEDLDFAHAGRRMSIALPANLRIDTDNAIKSLDMGLLPIRGLTDKAGATYLNPREPEFRLDFVTPLGRGEGPYEQKKLGINLQPLRFLEYSLEAVQQVAVFNGDRAVLVNVPAPARYALHKLLVTSERTGSFAAKRGKDLEQAAGLLSLLRDRSPWELEEAWRDLVARGPAWRKNFTAGLEQLDRRFPDAGFRDWFGALK